MTDRPPLRCEQVGADLLGNPAGATHTRRIAAHLASCARCRSLSRTLDRDRARIGRHLDATDWLPVADRVLAALPGPDRPSEPESQPRAIRPVAPMAMAPPSGAPVGPAGPGSGHRSGRRSGPIAASLRAACLVIVGLGLGLALQQVWPGNGDDRTAESTQFAATGRQDGALGGQPGTTDRTGTDASSAYVPAPGDNPPLAVSGGTGGITASQNRETWQSVRRTVQGGISPLLYPPVPPGTFDSVVIESLTTDAFAVRYASADSSAVMTAGEDAATATVRDGTSSVAVVRGAQATVQVRQTTTPGQGGLRLDGQASTALAPGIIVEVTWTETGRPDDLATSQTAAALPYRVTAASLPVDVVMTFVDSLMPFGSGWDDLREALPTGTTIVTPATLPDGFGPAGLIDQTVAADPNGDGTIVTWSVGYRRATSETIDRIVLSAAPSGDAVESGDLTVAGHPAIQSSTAATTDQPASQTVTWTSGATRYRIDFIGDGLTDTEVNGVLDGLTETSVPTATTGNPATSGRSATRETSRAT